jgi:hypothetical protein
VSNLGLMHEQPAKMLGHLAAGDVRGLGYDVAGQLHPFARLPIEYTTGQSLYFREPTQNLESNVGRILADVGSGLGVRDLDRGPVRHPLVDLADLAFNGSPLSRLPSAVRGLTDTRKGIPEKLMTNLSGLKLTDVSPKAQARTILKRAEDLAKAHNAKLRTEVYFSKPELEQLDKTNPQLANKQRALQKLLNRLQSENRKLAKESEAKRKAAQS